VNQLDIGAMLEMRQRFLEAMAPNPTPRTDNLRPDFDLHWAPPSPGSSMIAIVDMRHT